MLLAFQLMRRQKTQFSDILGGIAMPISTLNELYEHTKERLEGQHGTITITFANRSHVYTGNDVIGNCLQEWLPDWFRFLGVNIF